MTMVARWSARCDSEISQGHQCPSVVRGKDGEVAHEVWRAAQARGWAHDLRTGRDACPGQHSCDLHGTDQGLCAVHPTEETA